MESDPQCWFVQWGQESSAAAIPYFQGIGYTSVRHIHHCWCLLVMARHTSVSRFEAAREAQTSFPAGHDPTSLPGYTLCIMAVNYYLTMSILTRNYYLKHVLIFMSDSLSLPRALLHESATTKTKPTVWWWCVRRSDTVSSDMCTIGQNLMSCPASSAASQRIFSNFGVIQTKLRNRLGLQKTAKLVMCYRFLHGKEEIEWVSNERVVNGRFSLPLYWIIMPYIW
jgi:hypothetical protein